MIVFRANNYEIDLTAYGINLNEKSNFFIDNIEKSYSFSFLLPLVNEVAKVLGLPNQQNIRDYPSSVVGVLVMNEVYYDADFRILDIIGEQAECMLYFGEENIPVYDTELKDLPWPVHIVASSSELADTYLEQSWPAVTHNFPRYYRPEIKEKGDYSAFENFVNNYDGTDFIQNIESGAQPNIEYQNKNVLSPCPYMLEILRFGFLAAGKEVDGAVFDDQRLQKLVYMPENFIEKFKGALFLNFQFTIPDADTSKNGIRLGVYRKSFTPDNIGTYTVKFNLNIDPVIASYYGLKIYQTDNLTGVATEIYSQNSTGNRVTVNDEVNVNITNANQFNPITIELELPYITNSIAAYNGFEYSYREGRLNELIGTYSLGEYMPDMTFGEYVNAIKNWLNLDIHVNENRVTIDFLEDVLPDLLQHDFSHLEIMYPKKTDNSNRVFKLEYQDKSNVLVDKSGLLYSDIDKQKEDIIKIAMELQMAVVEQNYNVITAVYDDDADKLLFAMYDGLQGGLNNCIDKHDNFYARIEDVYHAFWSKWLNIRTNNFTISETFDAHSMEVLTPRNIYYKYNELLLPTKISKKSITENHWQVTMESETI